MLGFGVTGRQNKTIGYININKIIETVKADKNLSFLSLKEYNIIINEISGEWIFFDKDAPTNDVLSAISCLKAIKPIIKRPQTYPSSVILNTTNICNFVCSYCFADDFVCNRKKEFMNLSLAKKAVTELEKTPYENMRVEFQGGEPLLNFKLII